MGIAKGFSYQYFYIEIFTKFHSKNQIQDKHIIGKILNNNNR
jgi:hypothetical protein